MRRSILGAGGQERVRWSLHMPSRRAGWRPERGLGPARRRVVSGKRPMASRLALRMAIAIVATATFHSVLPAVPASAMPALQPPTATVEPSPTPVSSPTLAPTIPPTPLATDVPSPTPIPSAPPPPTAIPSPTSPPPTASITAVSSMTATEAPSPRPPDARPILVLDDVKIDPGRPGPGSSFHVDIDVRNEGTVHAHNVRLSLSSETFLPEGSSSAIWKSGIRPGEERDFETRMRVASATQSGAYPISVTLTWEDALGNIDSVQASIAVEVGGALAVRPLLAVVAVRAPGRVAPGAPFDVTFELVNNGGTVARNVVVAPSAGPLALYGGGQATPFDLGPGGRAAAKLRMIAAAQGDAGAVAQMFEIRYDDQDGERYTETRQIGLSITEDDAYGPLPMVSSYSTTGTLHPGEVFDLELEVTNVGASDALRSFLTFGGGAVPSGSGSSGTGGAALGVFAPLGRSNRVFLDRIASGQAMKLTQSMVIDGAAKPGVYILDVGLTYDDPDGKTQVSNEVVTLLVSRRVELQLSSIEVVTSTMVGSPVPFVVELVNAGSATVNVGTAEVVGSRYVGVESQPRFIGPLDASAADVIEAQLVPKAPGTATITVKLDYLDDFNQRQTFEKAYELEIMAAPERPEAEQVEGPPQSERSLIVRILRGLLGLGASEPAPAPASGPGFGSGPGGGPGVVGPGMESEVERPVEPEGAETENRDDGG